MIFSEFSFFRENSGILTENTPVFGGAGRDEFFTKVLFFCEIICGCKAFLFGFSRKIFSAGGLVSAGFFAAGFKLIFLVGIF